MSAERWIREFDERRNAAYAAESAEWFAANADADIPDAEWDLTGSHGRRCDQ